MQNFNQTQNDEDLRREVLIRNIEFTVGRLTLRELESLHYMMISQQYINDESH